MRFEPFLIIIIAPWFSGKKKNTICHLKIDVIFVFDKMVCVKIYLAIFYIY